MLVKGLLWVGETQREPSKVTVRRETFSFCHENVTEMRMMRTLVTIVMNLISHTAAFTY